MVLDWLQPKPRRSSGGGSRPNLPVPVAQEVPHVPHVPRQSPRSPAAPESVRLYSPRALGERRVNASPAAIVLHVLGARDLPRLRALNRPTVSPYVVIQALDETGAPVGTPAQWTARPGTRQPVWNLGRALHLGGRAMPSYAELGRWSLRVEVWDQDPIFPTQLLASTTVPFPALIPRDAHVDDVRALGGREHVAEDNKAELG